MKVILLFLTVVFVLPGSARSGSDDMHVLTPENAEVSGYWVRCAVKEIKEHSRTDAAQRPQPSGPAFVTFRLGLVHDGRLHTGPFAVNQQDLQVIKSISLVVRNGEDVLLSVPLRMEYDAGNYIHLLAEFSAQRETVSKMQIVFDEHSESGKRTMAINLKDFITEP